MYASRLRRLWSEQRSRGTAPASDRRSSTRPGARRWNRRSESLGRHRLSFWLRRNQPCFFLGSGGMGALSSAARGPRRRIGKSPISHCNFGARLIPFEQKCNGCTVRRLFHCKSCITLLSACRRNVTVLVSAMSDPLSARTPRPPNSLRILNKVATTEVCCLEFNPVLVKVH